MEKIAIMGLGRLGICLALNIERIGYSVLGFDISEDRVSLINQKKLQSTEPLVEEFLLSATNFLATSNIKEVLTSSAEIIFIVVPTPSLPDNSFNHDAIDRIIKELAAYGKQPSTKHVVINSTVMPGYCDSVKNTLGELNYTITYNPEFIAQGSIIKDQQFPDQVLIGETNPDTGNKIEAVYKKLCKNNPRYCRMSLVSAEITKLATNCFLTTKIAFANAVGDIATKVNAEPDKILNAIGSDSRIGEKYFKYGFGYGGPCFPRDNKAFTHFANNINYQMHLSHSTDVANMQHADFIEDVWKDKNSIGAPIIFDSVTYKKGTDILEESQQLKLALSLARQGYKIVIKESKMVISQLEKLYPNMFIYEINE
ncbi:MAG: UDP-glucose/GDP-mannose dehydrogenase family protein [Bacteroidetes bacterium]|nr:UDP-glucose/GDP-mannose dehydrogenase family protein [Bacteroidota bacterium]